LFLEFICQYVLFRLLQIVLIQNNRPSFGKSWICLAWTNKFIHLLSILLIFYNTMDWNGFVHVYPQFKETKAQKTQEPYSKCKECTWQDSEQATGSQWASWQDWWYVLSTCSHDPRMMDGILVTKSMGIFREWFDA
jgi:hypothetical protein